MKAKHNVLVGLICLAVWYYHLTFNATILDHPYMVLLMMTLIVGGGYNLIMGIAKMIFGAIALYKLRTIHPELSIKEIGEMLKKNQ